MLDTKKAGGGAPRAESPPPEILRQVQLVAGSLILLGVTLGTLVSPYFLGIAAFVGAGFVFAGATGTCGMATLLAKLPHNRRAPARPLAAIEGCGSGACGS